MRKFIIAGILGASTFVAAPAVTEAAGCATQTVVYAYNKVGCTLGAGDYVIRVAPADYGIYETLLLAAAFGGGQVITWKGGFAAVTYR